MSKANFVPYEGQENYIFISYAHRNSDEVLPILEKLNARGYRVWYDDGIAPGSEWPEYIADHLNGCAVFLAFVSPESIASPNCRREVTYALSKMKPFLGVILRETEMSPGMEMQLSAQQCILKYNSVSEEDFEHRLLSADILAPCMRSEEELAAIEKAAEERRQNALRKAEKERLRREEEARLAAERKAAEEAKEAARKASGTAITAEDMEAVRRMDETGKAPDGARTAPKKKIKPLFIAAPIALVAIIVGIIIATSGGGSGSPSSSTSTRTKAEKEEDTDEEDTDEEEETSRRIPRKITLPDGTELETKSEFLSLFNLTVDAEVMEMLSNMTNISDVHFHKCTFSDVSLDTLPHENVTQLDLDNCTGLTDYSFVSDYTELISLTITNGGVKTLPDLTGLEGLTIVCLEGNPEFSDLSVLPVTQLKRLNVGGTRVSDISLLGTAKALTELDLSGCPIPSADIVLGLEGLYTLDLQDTGISSFGVSCASLRLTKLYIGGCPAEDLSAFDNLTLLKELDISGDRPVDVQCFTNCLGTLEVVRMNGCTLSADSLASLAACPHLTEVSLNGATGVGEDLSFLANAASLKILRVDDTGITSLNGLSGKPALHDLTAARNQINDITALDALDNFCNLDLHDNQITDLSTLPVIDYWTLALHQNPLDVSKPITLSIDYISVLTMTYTEGIEGYKHEGLTVSEWYITDVPGDKVVALEDAIYGLDRRTVEELNDWIATYGIKSDKWPAE